MIHHLDGRALYDRIKEGDLDSEDVGDFLDAYLGGEGPLPVHLPELDGVASLFMASLPHRPTDAAIELWRAVVVHGDAESWAACPTGTDGIGTSWSFDVAGAATYGGGGGKGERRVIQGRVVSSDVDWAATCIMQAVKPEQVECRLLDSATVEVVAILDGHSLRPLPCPCAGGTFPASAPAADPSPRR